MDGRAGLTMERLAEHRTRCAPSGKAIDEQIYTNGRDAGLIVYCSPAGGLDAGRKGAAYHDVCPENFAATFLAAYQLGLRARELENDNRDLDARIETLRSLIGPSSSSGARGDSVSGSGRSMKQQIEQLRAKQAVNSLEISKIEAKANQF
jgi:hypothetical protein